MAGKWHLGSSKTGGEGADQWGFTHSYEMLSGGGNHWNNEEFLPNQRDPKTQADLKAGRVPPVSKERYCENSEPVERAAATYSNDSYTSKPISSLRDYSPLP